MRLDFFGLFSHGSRQRRDHGGEAVKATVGGSRLFSKLHDLCVVFSNLCGIRGDVCSILGNLLVVFQLLIVEAAERGPELIEAAEGGAHWFTLSC